MSKPKQIIILESINYLRKTIKATSEFLRPRLLMLIAQKQNEQHGVSKRDLAKQLGVNHNSIQNWRKLYELGGITKLMSHQRTGFKPSVISENEREGLRIILNNPSNGIQGYKELKRWFLKTYEREIPYTTLTNYCKRNFSTKIKVARKSHVKKDEKAVEAFKKTLIATYA